MSALNLLGDKYNRLTVIEQTEKRKNRKIVWKCQCDCGNIVEVASDALRGGRVKSCGCLKKEIMQGNHFAKGNAPKDITNQKFGHLTAIKRLDRPEGQNSYNWLCQCDCGNIDIIELTALTTNRRIDCNECKNKRTASTGEAIIMNLLNQASIQFQYLYKNAKCVFPDTNKEAEFDFYVNNKYIIEFDGEQHYKISSSSNWKPVNKIQEHDRIKNQWCFDNNIPIIRIPYTHLSKICLEDLLLETSSFIVRKPVEVTSD